jgi:hypothetical protein
MQAAILTCRFNTQDNTTWHAPLFDALELQQLCQVIPLLAVTALPFHRWRPLSTICIVGLLLLLLLLAHLTGGLLL